jgi:hypothetical protein
MPARNRILIFAALTTGLLLQGSSSFGDCMTSWRPGLYNTRAEVDGLAQALIKAQGFFA